MKKDFRKDLEKTARQMILIRRVDTLIKLVLRTIMRNINVSHAGVFLYDKGKEEYVVKVSRGDKGVKIPAGFAKLSKENSIVKYFVGSKYKNLPKDYLVSSRIKSIKNKLKKRDDRKNLYYFLEDIENQMGLCLSEVFIPGFFRKDLIGILFLGEKKNKKKFMPDELGFLSVLGSDVVMAIQNAWLIEDLNNQVNKTKKIFFDAINALGAAIETKDRYTGGHTA